MSPLLLGLGRLRSALARRRGAAALLGALAAALALFAAAALAGRVGLFWWAGWAPLAVWVAAAAIMGLAMRRAIVGWTAPASALRETAALVEREQVLRRCEIFAPGGGFVFNSIHNVQAQTPVENIVAMLDAVHEFNGEKHG